MDPKQILQLFICLLILGVMIYANYEIKEKLRKKKAQDKLFAGFPKELNNVWACYAWKNIPQHYRWVFPMNMPESTPAINIYVLREANKSDRVIAYRLDQRFGVYKLLGAHREGSDRAMWDDGMRYDLELVDVVPFTEAKRLTQEALPDYVESRIEREKELAAKKKEDDDLLAKCFQEQRQQDEGI